MKINVDLVLRTGTLNLYGAEILLIILGAEKFLQILPQQPKVGNTWHRKRKPKERKRKAARGLQSGPAPF